MVIVALMAHEQFFVGDVAGDVIAYASHLPNVSLWMNRISKDKWTTKHVASNGMEVIRNSLIKNRVPAPLLLDGHRTMLVCLDPYVYELKWKSLNYPVVATSPEGYFVAIASLNSAFTTECSYNLYGKRIGYTTESELLLIHAILYSYHIPKTAVELIYVGPEELLQLDKILDKTIDVFITYVIPNSLYYGMLRLLPVSLMGWQNIDLQRLRVFHPFISKRTNIDIKETFASPSPRSQLMVLDREKDSALLAISLNLYLVHGPRPPVSNVQESFITRLETSEELKDPAYQCYGDLTISHREVCNSQYDVSGMPKARGEETVWDRPCFQNEECPYFKANKNYSNSRGGCIRGRCEYPIGVQRKSYRHFVDKSPYTPFCYQCKTPDDPNCCEKQKDRKEYPKLVSPDYAFSNDKQARIRAKLPYYVSIM